MSARPRRRIGGVVTANKEKTMKVARIAVLVAGSPPWRRSSASGSPRERKGPPISPDTRSPSTGAARPRPSRTRPSSASTWRTTRTRPTARVERERRRHARASSPRYAAPESPTEDMQTVQVSVSPIYNDAGSKVTGYVATNSVCATTSVADAGSVAEAALKAGADRVDGPEPDEGRLRQALRRRAARRRGGRSLARGSSRGCRRRRRSAKSFRSRKALSPPTRSPTTSRWPSPEAPIQPGTQDIEATVTVTYAIA